MVKKLAAVWILAAVLVFLSACGGADTSNQTENAPKAETAQTADASEKAEEKTAEKSTEAAEPSTETADRAQDVSSEESPQAETDQTSETSSAEQQTEAGSEPDAVTAADAPAIEGLTFDHAMPLDYADCFAVYYYEDGYKLIDVFDSAQYLIIPEGAEAPEGIDPEIVLIYQPVTQAYMAATGSMSFIDQIDAMDCVTMSSLDKDGWVIDAPKKAMEAGTLVYAGKYSEPDYELMVGKGCDLALESTMILHSPEVQEMIEDLGIPVFIDRSSYELDAFGRIEWIKLYGAIFNKEELAEEKFKDQEAILDELKDYENTGKTVAFFAVNTNNTITVRRSKDFIPNMIELAGGKYIFDDLDPAGSSASVRLSMEEFYNTAVNADYLIYNGTIEEPLSDIDDLIAKDALFSEFKAVKEGNVWTVDKTWYQSTATIGYLITDLNRMLNDGDPNEMVFLHKVD